MDTPEPSRHHGPDEQDAIRHVVTRLTRQFPHVPIADIERIVHGHHSMFADRPVRDFVPMLVERASRADLRRDG